MYICKKVGKKVMKEVIIFLKNVYIWIAKKCLMVNCVYKIISWLNMYNAHSRLPYQLNHKLCMMPNQQKPTIMSYFYFLNILTKFNGKSRIKNL